MSKNRTLRVVATANGAIETAILCPSSQCLGGQNTPATACVQNPLQWTEELARFLMLWTGFLAMNVAMHHGMHLKIDALVNVLPNWMKHVLGYVCDILIGCFLVILVFKGYGMTKNTMMLASSMKLSMVWIYMAVPLGAFLTLIQHVLQVGRKILT